MHKVAGVIELGKQIRGIDVSKIHPEVRIISSFNVYCSIVWIVLSTMRCQNRRECGEQKMNKEETNREKAPRDGRQYGWIRRVLTSGVRVLYFAVSSRTI